MSRLHGLRRSLPPLLSVMAMMSLIPPLPVVCAQAPANRLSYLDEFSSPFHPSHTLPGLITPMWVGEPGVEAVVTYGIDDMSGHGNYERYLRPILDRLNAIDGRSPVSIFCNSPDPREPHLQQWLGEGLSFEAHTLSHPCPILEQGRFHPAENTFHGCVDLLNHIPGNVPVAFRTPCCDSINSPSPRLFAEIFGRTNSAGQFLRMDSSVTLLLTTNDPALPAEKLVDSSRRPRFAKYVPFEAFGTTIENYPYPYVHTRTCWEMPFLAPSDWQSQNIQGNSHPGMLEDWKVALDLIVLKQGTLNFVIHPAQWSSPDQHVSFIDHAIATHGARIRFLNYREVHERLTRHLLAGQPLRAADGGNNGVRILDLNNDGFMDVVIGNDDVRLTRLWNPESSSWTDAPFPTRLSGTLPTHRQEDRGARFGIVGPVTEPVMILRNDEEEGAWRFRGGAWISEPELLKGLEVGGTPVLTASRGADRGVRLRDVNNDGACEVVVGNPDQGAVFRWDPARQSWRRESFNLPAGASIVDAQGRDGGLRFVDLNADGYDDAVFSDEDAYSIHLMVPKLVLGFQPGWSREVIRGRRGTLPEVPRIVRGGLHPNNGAWFTRDTLYVQNEDTAKLPHRVQRHTFGELLGGFMPPALGPDASLATVQVPEGFRIELVAAEPTVIDPAYLQWGGDGRLWVVEMRDYPMGVDGRGKPGGVVKVLEDRNSDGRYETSTVFAEGLQFPNGILPWRKGVLISSAPDILYAEDANGDGRADGVVKLFTGFGLWNQQHLLNGFEYGLDNWVYGANGDSGGEVRPGGGGPGVSISGRDFRFRPDSGEFQAIEGQTQFGRRRDDWGNWFGNANPVWLWHYWIPDRYLRRNPRLAVRSMRRETADYPGAGAVLSVGRKPQRLNDVGTAGYVTSANSPTPYRDTLFGAEFARAVFISEPVYNAIRCEVLEPRGISFVSRRWNPASTREFIASSDAWFRPAGMRVGPDGALYFCDMYRQYIEHPEWIPDDIKSRYNMRAGDDKGRIYRVYPKAAALRPTPRLDGLDTPSLVAALDHVNGWQRDTAQHLLVARADRSAAGPLRALARQSQLAQARISAWAALEGLGSVEAGDIVIGLADSHGAVREHVLRISEPLLAAAGPRGLPPGLADALDRCVVDPEFRVRYQLAFSLGEWNSPEAGRMLGRLALASAGQEDILTAISSSSSRQPQELFMALAGSASDAAGLEPLMRNLTAWVLASGDRAAAGSLLDRILTPVGDGGAHALWQIGAYAQCLQESEKSGRGLPLNPDAQARVASLLTAARALASDDAQPAQRRITALALLGREPGLQARDVELLATLLQPRLEEAIRQAALARMGQISASEVPSVLLARWAGHTPSLRGQVLELLLRREEWTITLLRSLGMGGLALTDLTPSIRQRLLTHAAEAVRRLAVEHLGQVPSSQRQAVVDDYLPRVKQARPDAAEGGRLFAQHCAACHKLNQQGSGAAPDLAMLVDRSPERMLIAILDPNRAVEDRYRAYSVVTQSGEEHSGMLTAESANSITLAGATGTQETLLRADISSLRSSGASFMPEGFEQVMTPQGVSDLLGYLETAMVPPRRFPGNQPALVQRGADGAYVLPASQAEIHGDGIAFEQPLQNVGSWNSLESYAAWNVDLKEPGDYEVWIEWACHADEAGDMLQLQAGEAAVVTQVASTGSWENYQRARVGTLRLAAGLQRIIARAQAPLRAYLMDLRELRIIPVGARRP